MQCVGFALDTDALPRCIVELRVQFGNAQKLYDMSGALTNMVALADVPATFDIGNPVMASTQQSSMLLISNPVLAIANPYYMSVINVEILDALTGNLLQLQAGGDIGENVIVLQFIPIPPAPSL
jgi:hypothetical protein